MHNQFLEKIKQYNTIIIHRHSRPDGDALGTQVGVKETILKNFPEKRVLATGDVNEKYSFIGKMDDVKDEDYNGALVIVVDTGTPNLISDDRYTRGDYLIKIDHHVSGTAYADLNIINTQEISCASLFVNLWRETGLPFSDHSAMALFTGLVSDSFRFRYQGVNSNTFEVASLLTKYNFSIEDVYSELFNEDESHVLMRAKFTLSVQKTKNNVRYIKTTHQEVLDSKADFYFISRDLVSVMGGIKGVDIWVNFTEDEAGFVHAELRSSKYNINKIAVKYGGGGHLLASGARLKSFEEADKMLKDLDQLLEEGL